MKSISNHFKKMLFLAALVLGTMEYAFAAASPIQGGGPFGLGVEYGYPGTWGVVGNLWVSYKDSFQPAVKFEDDGQAILQLDYLWHNYHVFHVHSGEMPVYIGLGGDLTLTDPAELALRVPIGLSYIFGHGTPLDIYAQVVPTVWFDPDNATFHLYGNIGLRFYP